MERINAKNVPAAIGPYVHAVEHNGIIFTSGQLGVDHVSNLLPEDFDTQAINALKNLNNVLKEAGSDFSKIIKTNVYMTDLSNFAAFNQIYKNAFNEDFPARTAIQINALPMGAEIEIEAVAFK